MSFHFSSSSSYQPRTHWTDCEKSVAAHCDTDARDPPLKVKYPTLDDEKNRRFSLVLLHLHFSHTIISMISLQREHFPLMENNNTMNEGFLLVGVSAELRFAYQQFVQKNYFDFFKQSRLFSITNWIFQ